MKTKAIAMSSAAVLLAASQMVHAQSAVDLSASAADLITKAGVQPDAAPFAYSAWLYQKFEGGSVKQVGDFVFSPPAPIPTTAVLQTQDKYNCGVKSADRRSSSSNFTGTDQITIETSNSQTYTQDTTVVNSSTTSLGGQTSVSLEADAGVLFAGAKATGTQTLTYDTTTTDSVSQSSGTQNSSGQNVISSASYVFEVPPSTKQRFSSNFNQQIASKVPYSVSVGLFGTPKIFYKAKYNAFGDTANFNRTFQDAPLTSSNGKYKLIGQGDGNLVIYTITPSGESAIWGSGTNKGAGNYNFVFQGDGNLVIYSSGKAIWASNTAGKGGNRLVMQNDGNLVIYGNNGAVWASNTVKPEPGDFVRSFDRDGQKITNGGTFTLTGKVSGSYTVGGGTVKAGQQVVLTPQELADPNVCPAF